MACTGRDPAAMEGNSNHPAAEALALMQKALDLLDSTDAPPDAGACLDLAIHRLREWLEGSA